MYVQSSIIPEKKAVQTSGTFLSKYLQYRHLVFVAIDLASRSHLGITFHWMFFEQVGVFSVLNVKSVHLAPFLKYQDF